MNQRGFTWMELVMVVTVLVILGAVAVPQYMDLQREARLANEAGVVAGIRAGILTFFIDPVRGNRVHFPPTLDGAADGLCSPANPCFTNVLGQGGITELWIRLSMLNYRSPVNPTNIWTYNSLNGSFVQTAP